MVRYGNNDPNVISDIKNHLPVFAFGRHKVRMI